MSEDSIKLREQCEQSTIAGLEQQIAALKLKLEAAKTALVRIRDYPFHSEMIGSCMNMADIAKDALAQLNSTPMTETTELDAISCACVHHDAEQCARIRDGIAPGEEDIIRRKCECCCHRREEDDSD